MGSILVIKLSALGDLIQAVGAIADIRRHHLDDRLTIMTMPQYRQVMERCPFIDDIIVDPRASRFNLAGLLALRRKIRSRRFNLVYDLQQVGRTRFYYRWLFPPVQWLGDAAGCTFYLRRPKGSCAADHFARHLRSAGLATRHSLSADISWLADDATRILAEAGLAPGFVVLVPGASALHKDKRWPYFGELAQLLLEKGRRVVTIPGPDELELCRTMPGDMLVPAAGYHDIFALAGIVRQAAFVIGNDTGPTHIAAHLGCRGLALYGGHTSAVSTGIQHTRFSWLEAGSLADLPLSAVWAHVMAKLSLPEADRCRCLA